MAVLLGAENVAGATDLEVGQRDLETGAQLGRVEDRLQSLPSDIRQLAALAVEQVRVGAAGRSADATAQLIELGESERVGAVDDDRVRVGYIQARLDDRR